MNSTEREQTGPQTQLDQADQADRAKYEQAHSPARAQGAEDNIITGAWLTAFLVPIVGFVLGVILVTRQREGHGIWAMIVSTIMPFIWFWLYSWLYSLPRY